MKPPPVYSTPYPENINININESLNKMAKNVTNKNDDGNINSQRNCNHLDFFTDGSCNPNPGPGGCGYYSPNFGIKSKIHVVDHDTSINYCELYGILLVLQSVNNYINFCKMYNSMYYFDSINIYTDSKFVCDLMSINGFPK